MELRKHPKVSRFEEMLREKVSSEAKNEEGLPVLVKVASGTPEEFQIMLNVFAEEYCNKRGYRISTVSNLVETTFKSGSITYKSNRVDVKDGMATRTDNTYDLSQTFVFVKDTK